MESFRDNEEHILERTSRPPGLNIPPSACEAKAITSLFKLYDFFNPFPKETYFPRAKLSDSGYEVHKNNFQPRNNILSKVLNMNTSIEK